MGIRTPLIIGLATAAVCVTTLPASAETGFSYVEPAATGVAIKVLATSGDVITGYQWPGTPDGIGVVKDGKNLNIYVNHEFSSTNKAAAALKHANGNASASTVSHLTMNTDSNTITSARNLLQSVTWYDYSTGTYGTKPVAPSGASTLDEYGTPNHTTALNRFCSSSLAQPGSLAYKTKVGGKDVTYGYTGAAYFTGEEGSDESRAFVTDMNGNLIQLPKLGLAAWENFIPAPSTGIRTIVMGNEDGSATDSQLFMYVGEKTTTGHWTDMAGLTNGQQYVMAIDGIATDNVFRASKGKSNPTSVTFAAIDTSVNGKAQNAQARALGTEMARVEDGAFDPNSPNDFYFVTTESNKDPKATAPNPATPTVSRDGGALWRLRFNDVKNPTAGATVTMLLDGSESPYLSKPDNIDVDTQGNVLIQEDPGNNDLLARIVSYRISDGKVATVAKFSDKYFKVGATQFITRDEESSGITDVTSMLRKGSSDKNSYYVFDAQVHATPAGSRLDLWSDPAAVAALSSAVEGGQLYLMTVADWSAVYGS